MSKQINKGLLQKDLDSKKVEATYPKVLFEVRSIRRQLDSKNNKSLKRLSVKNGGPFL